MSADADLLKRATELALERLDAALAADWLTSTWDQNATLYVSAPSNSVAEEAASHWLLEILRLPSTASVGLTTGDAVEPPPETSPCPSPSHPAGRGGRG